MILWAKNTLVGPDGPIRKMLTAKQIFPMIFWGPPGNGENHFGADYRQISRGRLSRTLRRLRQQADVKGLLN